MTRKELFNELYTKISMFTNAPKEDVDTIANTILDAIEHNPEEPVSLFDKLNYLDCGSYKVVYNPIQDIVIKFCSIENPTYDEQDILKRAEEEGVLQYFVPTEFIDLTLYKDVYLTEDTDCGDHIFNFIEIQPKVDIRFSLVCDKEIHDIARRAGVSNEKWIEDAISAYGEESFKNLLNFCGKHNIYDLHEGNVGYLNKIPVILDWLSGEEY